MLLLFLLSSCTSLTVYSSFNILLITIFLTIAVNRVVAYSTNGNEYEPYNELLVVGHGIAS